MTPFISRLERLGEVDSTQRVVREWLDDGTPEVCVATADVQHAGRGRQGRSWTAPPGRALMVSVGFRPRGLPLTRGWRLAATAALAMADAAEDVGGLLDGTIRLKWPNDLVVETDDGLLRKLAGVLGETAADGGDVRSAVIGLGINADWAKAEFPADLAASMTSLREVSGGRPIDRNALLEGFLDRLEPRYVALAGGRFDAGSWSVRQATTGHTVEVTGGGEGYEALAVGVDPESGGLLVERHGGVRSLDSADVTRCRVMASLRDGREGRNG